ncbi:MAG: endonuclease [Actinobacteria bacterium HGW-Actinobacteria-4]|nr:MAG: endonuclease [Actinobacteria bacterium HGW-Actinobacteria-4]
MTATTGLPGDPGFAFQPGLDTIGEPLSQTTFVVIDLETTGGSPALCGITEIGAVKTRGGELVGEYQTLVNPGVSIPPMIVALTGITDFMLVEAPRIEAVIPSLIEFMGDAVLVAHNAPFDVGFLKAAFRAHGYSWPGNEVVDTVTLARRATTKEEAPNKKLATLARVFGSTVTPNHRALEDARATSQVLYGMLERLSRFGITHREDLDALRNPVPEKLRRKAIMADAVPAKPGVYTFRGPHGEALYVGTSKNLRSRVKTYFTRGEHRRQMRDMLELAVSVDTVVCPTELEANVLELRLIAEYRPRFNRRSARPERTPWIRLTDERYPRLSITRSAGADGTALGPMRGAGDARAAVEVFHQAMSVRTCTTRLPAVPRADARACLLRDMGQCAAPCVAGEGSGYDSVIAAARAALVDDPSPVVTAMADAVAGYAATLSFERAAQVRDGVSAIVEAGMRHQRLAAIRRCRIVAVRKAGDGWDMAAFAHGGLVGSAHVQSGVWSVADGLQALADASEPREVLIEEQEKNASWLESTGTRLLHVDGDWAQPVASAGRHHLWVSARRSDHEHLADFTRR